jgi:hypothetical protein
VRYLILSQEANHIRIYEDYYGGTYDIILNDQLSFSYAIRWMDRIGINPIRYESIEEIPAIHRSIIEEVILKRKLKLRQLLTER